MHGREAVACRWMGEATVHEVCGRLGILTSPAFGMASAMLTLRLRQKLSRQIITPPCSQRGADVICKLEMRPKFGLVSIEYFGGAHGAN